MQSLRREKSINDLKGTRIFFQNGADGAYRGVMHLRWDISKTKCKWITGRVHYEDLC